ncbi:uncharacterized protein PV07_09027 [Cladophialophora immunda]|uniref:Zn(2)-C6 fungal-type domain-containing protein n=1 Tax=Cladophialophora immunda TaxID=569365 RepID=A0A0D1ZDT1_9EURO|nr:uncharacterized protein PV07_09027 [Cladophialophora immunda]KIW25891.1 hypothetical protein PV07_09027 [Cladophialophora immunda]OQV10694.1 Fungal Zn2-Cys6 binuclear cluster domain-containing protein [Cladophialophora immunda]
MIDHPISPETPKTSVRDRNTCEQTAGKGCRTCARRRILCDRTLPTCRKCSSKGLGCPGYQRQLRWTSAVAVRGPLKHLSPAEAFNARSLTDKPKLSENPHGDRPTPNVAIEPEPQIPTFSLDRPVIDRFFEYYASHIAPMMVWLDSDANGYRRLILPMAEQHLILRLAICAISAAHMPQEPQYGLKFSSATGDATMAMIAAHVRQINNSLEVGGNGSAGGENRSLECTLAAMLILANQSLLGSELPLARFHRQAARVMLERLSSQRSPSDELFAFLKNQLALCDILMCTTMFDAEHIHTVILPEFANGDVILGRFLTIVHRITRRSLDIVAVDALRDDDAYLDELESELELAQGPSLMVAGQMISQRSQSAKEDFTRLIHVFHHAGVLYACQRLRLGMGFRAQFHLDKLFRSLKQFHNVKAVLHNLAWPVFIAGICDWTTPEQKATISEICGAMSMHTGFGHYSRIQLFLQDLWQTPHKNWILLAKGWEAEGNPVVAV